MVPYLLEILENLPLAASEISIWSDGPSQQFKNKFIFNFIKSIVNIDEFGFQSIMWSYFATSHGKGAVDGVGAAVKMNIRRKILSRKIIVRSAKDFVENYSGTVNVLLFDEDKRNQKLNTYDVHEMFNNATNIPHISLMHSVYAKKNKPLEFSSLTKNM